jgi:hypothetical protein
MFIYLLKKIIGIALVILLWHSLSFAQVPNVNWAQVRGTATQEGAWRIIANPQGGYYTVSLFKLATTISGVSFTQMANSNFDWVIAKYNASNQLQWTVQMYEDGGQMAFPEFKADLAGNLYTVNYATSVVHVGSASLTAAYPKSIWGCKINANGSVAWLNEFGRCDGGFTGQADIFDVDISGNILFGVWAVPYQGNNPIFGGSPVYVDPNLGSQVFVSFSTNGNFLFRNATSNGYWGDAKIGYCHNDFDAYTVATNTNDFILDRSGSGVALPAAVTGSSGVFVAKTQASSFAYIRWAKRIEGSASVMSVDVDTNDNLYVFGNATSALNFGNNITLTQNNPSLFVAKYNNTGTPSLVKTLATGSVAIRNSTIDNQGNLYICGNITTGSATFNNGQQISTSNANEGFVAKFNANGVCLWVIQCNSTNGSTGIMSVQSTNTANEIYIAGTINGSATIQNTTMQGVGNLDPFFIKMSGVSVGVENESLVQNISAFPNPNRGIFSIQMPTTEGKIQVINALGTTIIERFIRDTNTEIDIQSQEDGIFFVEITTKEGRFIQKIIKQ